MQSFKALASLCIGADSPPPLLLTGVISTEISCTGPLVCLCIPTSSDLINTLWPVHSDVHHTYQCVMLEFPNYDGSLSLKITLSYQKYCRS